MPPPQLDTHSSLKKRWPRALPGLPAVTTPSAPPTSAPRCTGPAVISHLRNRAQCGQLPRLEITSPCLYDFSQNRHHRPGAKRLGTGTKTCRKEVVDVRESLHSLCGDSPLCSHEPIRGARTHFDTQCFSVWLVLENSEPPSPFSGQTQHNGAKPHESIMSSRAFSGSTTV